MAYPAEPVTDHVVNRLKELRAQQGLAMQAVAERAGITRPYLSFLERGQRRPTLDVTLRWAAALNASLPDLLSDAMREVANDESA